MIFPVLLLAIVIPSFTAREVCTKTYAIKGTINMFENYTDLVSFDLDCSQTSLPSVIVTAGITLREQMTSDLSRNSKVAFSVKCTGNTTDYYNVTTAPVKKRAPWVSTLDSSSDKYIPFGQNCSIIGCFFDEYRASSQSIQRRYAVKGSSCIINPNECLYVDCEHDCIDTFTGYECSCWTGYQKDSNNSHNCTDVNECSTGDDNCSHNCTNTDGGYTCSCPTGMEMINSNFTCSDIDECASGNYSCEHECVNTNGSYECACRQGFQLSSDGSSCEDIDECQSPNNSYCHHHCTNIVGGYYCSCDPGYTLGEDKHKCLDIDECENTKLCSQICVNTSGSYHCQCYQGYVLNDDDHNCTKVPSSGSTDDTLVVFMPWVVPLLFMAVMILLSVFIYYSFLRRRKHGNVLETNPDLYNFYLTQEKLDCTYQPVDLSSGLCFDKDSLHSEVTSIHSASNTVEDLATTTTSSKIQVVIANKGDTFSSTEDLKSDINCQKKSNGNLAQLEEVPLECSGTIDSQSMHDSCIGSSIAGETSSGLRSSTAMLYSPDTSGSSFSHSNDTSASSDYIPTTSGTSRTPLSHPSTSLATAVLTAQSHTPPESDRDLTNSTTTKSENSSLQANGKRDQKDYIHATNSLFSVINDNSNSSNC